MSRQLLAQLLDVFAVFFAPGDRHFLVPKNEFVSDCNKCIANRAADLSPACKDVLAPFMAR